MPQPAVAELFSLSIPERIQLAEDIRDSIAIHPEKVDLAPNIKTELDKRLDDHRQNPDDVSTWDEVRSRLWRAL